jgi:hypothetical protein
MSMTQEEIDALINSGGLEEDSGAEKSSDISDDVEESLTTESPDFPEMDYGGEGLFILLWTRSWNYCMIFSCQFQ